MNAKAKITIKLEDGTIYDIIDNWNLKEETKEEALDSLLFYWEEGNNSCDCNRHIYVNRQYGTNYPEECGSKTELLSFEPME